MAGGNIAASLDLRDTGWRSRVSLPVSIGRALGLVKNSSPF